MNEPALAKKPKENKGSRAMDGQSSLSAITQNTLATATTYV